MKREQYIITNKNDIPFFNAQKIRQLLTGCQFKLIGCMVTTTKESEEVYFHKQELLFDITDEKTDPRLFVLDLVQTMQRDKQLVSWSVVEGGDDSLVGKYINNVDPSKIKAFSLQIYTSTLPRAVISLFQLVADAQSLNMLGMVIMNNDNCKEIIMLFEDVNNPFVCGDAFRIELEGRGIRVAYSELKTNWIQFHGVFENRSV